MVETHGLTGHVVMGNTDCEPSMVKARRILTEKAVLMHVGCTCHRIECVTALVFDGPGVKKSMALARAVVTRYTKSSQAAERLRELCGIVGIIRLRLIQDVETRWWSTQSMAERLVYLRRAVELHESLNNVTPPARAGGLERLGAARACTGAVHVCPEEARVQQRDGNLRRAAYL